MHVRYLAERNQNAEARIKAAARTLAQGADLDDLIICMETAHDRDIYVRDMLRREALADLLDAVVAFQSRQDDRTERLPARRGRPPAMPRALQEVS